MCIRDRVSTQSTWGILNIQMPIFDEVWEENDYAFRKQLNFKSLPRNHLERLSELRFDFVEYKTNHHIACHVYERMTTLCHNQYGWFRDFYRPECLEAANFFEMCLKLNAGFGLIKKYFPENFAVSPWARPVPQPVELGLYNDLRENLPK
eukprot:TRINITY_DN554_c0_g1_i3.p1 TRINITY_DN554_c0_g1~~TRINITY_DN554_c0_g1_i3.p1  ORF type:complete len:150 (+),score=42.37 TRINITY_DN554_c0_g1_i3:72-521(+)